MSIDINRLSPKELDVLINQAKKRKTTLSKRKPIAAVRKKVRALAESEGYSIAELFGGASATKAAKPRAGAAGRKLGKVPAKYRNPANPKETWTGRGKQPRWLATETAKGRKLDEFLIK
ncbi:MAG: H-NS histone family protein [Lysobacteraceae bacterium]